MSRRLNGRETPKTIGDNNCADLLQEIPLRPLSGTTRGAMICAQSGRALTTNGVVIIALVQYLSIQLISAPKTSR